MRNISDLLAGQGAARAPNPVDWAMVWIGDLISEASVDEPADHGAGYSVSHDENALRAYLTGLLGERLSPLSPEVDAIISFQEKLTYLRADEGDSVTLLCDNLDPASPDQNNAIECNGGWTDWKDRRFQGETLGAAVQAAVEAKRAVEAEVLPAKPLAVAAGLWKPIEGPDRYAIKAAISLAMQDELDGLPCGCIIEAGCAARGYDDPAYAANSFLDEATENVLQALGPQPTGSQPVPVENPAEVVGFQWQYDTGKRLPFVADMPTPWRCYGMVQVWIMRNGQEVRATWKERA